MEQHQHFQPVETMMSIAHRRQTSSPSGQNRMNKVFQWVVSVSVTALVCWMSCACRRCDADLDPGMQCFKLIWPSAQMPLPLYVYLLMRFSSTDRAEEFFMPPIGYSNTFAINAANSKKVCTSMYLYILVNWRTTRENGNWSGTVGF